MINDTILMKPISKLITLSLGILLAGCSGKEAPSTTDELSLHFNDQGTFKVIQMTDTHICWENQEEYAKEISLLKKNVSLRDCQALTGTSINTLRKLKAMFV